MARLSRRGAALVVPVVAVVAAGRWAIDRVLVEGDSMLPTFEAGDRLLLVRRWRPLRVGDLVVLDDPARAGRRLVKRVVGLEGGVVEVRGDNAPSSTDSRSFGAVAPSSVGYLVVRRYSPGPTAGV